MGLFSLFSKKNKSVKKSKLDYSKINLLIDKDINTTFIEGTYIRNNRLENSDTPNLVKAIDGLLEKDPNNCELLFAKSEAQYAYLNQTGGKVTRKKVLQINPQYFDAKLREKYPDNWTNLFSFPYFNENFNKLPENINNVWSFNNFSPFQLVRDNLNITILFIAKALNDFSPEYSVVDFKWEPILKETPYGPIFMHYMMVKFNDGFVLKREGSLHPYGFHSDKKSGGKDFFLLRLANSDSIFLTCAKDKDVVFNKRYLMREDQKQYLKEVVAKLKTQQAPDSYDFYSAKNWYLNNSNLADIQF